MKCPYTAVFETPDGFTIEQPYLHIQELDRLTKEYRRCGYILVDIY